MKTLLGVSSPPVAANTEKRRHIRRVRETIVKPRLDPRTIPPWKMILDSLLLRYMCVYVCKQVGVCVKVTTVTIIILAKHQYTRRHHIIQLPSQFRDKLIEGILPSIHLNDPDSRNYFIHDAYTLVCHQCRLEPDWTIHITRDSLCIQSHKLYLEYAKILPRQI